jgi:Domain of unknown function (DUF222)
LWLAPTWDQMVAVNGLLEPEAGQTLLAALEPLTRPHSADDSRSGGQRTADALTELARRALEGGQLPQTGGVRPQLTITVDLDSLLGRPGALGGEVGWAGPLDPETCQRLACDGALTRVLVTRQPSDHRHPDHDHPSAAQGSSAPDPGMEGLPLARDPGGDGQPLAGDPSRDAGLVARGPGGVEGLGVRLRAAMALLPPALGGARPSRWRSAGPAGSSRPPNAAPWPSATAAVSSPTANGRWPGAKPTICGIGCTAAPPTWPTWPCCAEPTIGSSTRAAGGWPAAPTVASPPPHPTGPAEDTGSRPDPGPRDAPRQREQLTQPAPRGEGRTDQRSRTDR